MEKKVVANRDTRFQRQLDILNPDKCKEPVCIIGAGATGSFVATALAKMGMTNIKIFDKDTVEEHNFPNQMFPIEALGKNKAEAVKEVVKKYAEVDIESIPEFYDTQELEGIVISALDSMSGRKQIYENVKKNPKVKLLIDPRTGAEVFRMFTVIPSLELSCKLYEPNLFSDEEADEAPCTARAIIYSVLLVSSYICNQVKRYLMDQDFKRDIFIDIANDYSFSN